MALTPKQERFCEEYIIDLNGAQAAIRAGYSEESARQIASDCLTKHDIQDRIAELRTKISTANGNLVQRVIDELIKVGFSNIQDYIDAGNEVKDLSHIDSGKASAIAGVKKSTTNFGDGKGNEGTKEVVEFKLWDKISALEKIGRHLGIFEKDNSQSKPEIPQPFSDAQVDRIISGLRAKNETN